MAPPGPGTDPRTGNGFSLVEVMVTLAVTGVLLAAAAPGFMTMVYDDRISSQINGLLADVGLARLEAIKRNRDVVLCRSSDGRHCRRSTGPGADWSSGWIVYVNSDGDARRDPDEPLLQVHSVLPRGMSLHFNQWWRVIYHSDGSARNGTFTLCDSRGSEHARALILYYTGRPRVSNKRPDRRPLDCG